MLENPIALGQTPHLNTLPILILSVGPFFKNIASSRLLPTHDLIPQLKTLNLHKNFANEKNFAISNTDFAQHVALGANSQS